MKLTGRNTRLAFQDIAFVWYCYGLVTVIHHMESEKPLRMVKTTVNLPADTVELLRGMAVARGTTVTDVLRRAIWLEKYFYDATMTGARILVEEPDKIIKEVVIR